MYKNILARAAILTCTIAAGSLSAQAADLDATPQAKGWTGFYVGAAVGAGGVNHEIGVDGLFEFDGFGADGIFGSVYAGYDYQIAPRWVVGVQAEYNFGEMEFGIGAFVPDLVLVDGFALADYNVSADESWSVIGKVGYLTGPDTQLYVLGGYTHQEFSANFDIFADLGGFDIDESDSYGFDAGGFVVGAGIENRISDKLSLKLEYRYTQLEDISIVGPLEVTPSFNTVRLGLSYKFGDGERGESPDFAAVPIDWTGFLVGVDVGAATQVTELDLDLAPFAAASLDGLGAEGIVGGVRIGYDHQVSDRFVIGAHATARASSVNTELDILGFEVAEVEENYEISIFGRAGYLTTPDTLWYVLAGGAYAEYEFSIAGEEVASFDHWGYVVGAGVETAITENITARLEYRFTQYEDDPLDTGGAFETTNSTHTALLGLSYKFPVK